MKTKLSRRILRLVAGAALLVWLILWVEWRQLLAALMDCDPGWAVAGAILFAAATLPAALRLKALFHPRELSFGSALRFTLESGFFSQLLPTGLGGDAHRSLRLKDAAGGWVPTIGLLAFERGASALTLIVPALACAMLQLGGTPIAMEWREHMDSSQAVGISLSALGVLFATAGLILVLRTHHRLQRIWHALVSTLRQLTLATVTSVLVLSLCFHSLRILGTLAFLEAVGKSVALGDLVVAMALTLVATLAPVTGSLGVREGVIVYCLHAYGVPLPEALTVALLGRLVVVLLGVAGAVVFFTDRRQTRDCAVAAASVRSTPSEPSSPLVQR